MDDDRWNDLQAFLEFVRTKLDSGEEIRSLDDALWLWDFETLNEVERAAYLDGLARQKERGRRSPNIVGLPAEGKRPESGPAMS